MQKYDTDSRITVPVKDQKECKARTAETSFCSEFSFVRNELSYQDWCFR